jgi:hypothetical protein
LYLVILYSRANGNTNLFLSGEGAKAYIEIREHEPVHEKNKDSIFIREEYIPHELRIK